MKKAFCLFFWVLFTGLVNAQDLLVTAKGDSLNCKVTKEDDRYLYFSYKEGNELKKTLISRADVQTYQRSFFAPSEWSAGKMEKAKVKTFKPVKLGISGGWGYRTAKVAGANREQKDYLKGLRSGFQLSADLDCYFNDFFGIGLKYSLFRTSTDGTIGGIRTEDKTTTHYVGPVFAMRSFNLTKKNVFIMNYSLGYLSYIDRGKGGSSPAKISAGTLGMVMDLGYEVGVSQKLAIAFQLSGLLGSFSNYTLEQGGISREISLSKDERENLSRVDLSIGIRFYP